MPEPCRRRGRASAASRPRLAVASRSTASNCLARASWRSSGGIGEHEMKLIAELGNIRLAGERRRNPVQPMKARERPGRVQRASPLQRLVTNPYTFLDPRTLLEVR